MKLPLATSRPKLPEVKEAFSRRSSISSGDQFLTETARVAYHVG